MSLHKSLKVDATSTRHRNVLKRDERWLKLIDDGRRSEDDSIFNLPKVRSIKQKRKSGKAAKAAAAAAAEAEAAAETEADAAKKEEE